MLCSDEDSARKYVNYIARAICVLTKYPFEYEKLLTYEGIETLTSFVDENLNIAFNQGMEVFFAYLKSLIEKVEDESTLHRFIMARAIAIWLDRRMTYELDDESNACSIASLVPFSIEPMIRVENLNDNEKQTGVCIMPMLPAVKCYAHDDKHPDKPREKSLYISEALSGINNELLNCRYRKYDENIIVEHVVISWHTKNTNHSDCFRVAFTPLTDDSELLVCEDETMPDEFGKIRKKKFGEPLKYEMLEERFRETLRLASKSGHKIDLLFGPEMLGTERMYQIDDQSGFVPYIEKVMEEYEEDAEERPKLIVLPSRTKDRKNYCYIVDDQGQLLGIQEKTYPYTDNKNHYEESLDNQGKTRVLVIQIPDYERIVIMICKDFLKEGSELHDLIFRHINPTLVIVPSYTIGETAFTASLSTVSHYGTSVVWGTCCGAPRSSNPYIGAASAIYIDKVPKMSDACVCEQSCTSCKACMFYIDLPLKTQDRIQGTIAFKHQCG